MSDTPNAPPLAVDEQPTASPVLLKQAREASGLHIAALAAALKVPVRKLEALESGRYDELPDMTFARALASSACRQLKIDPEPVLAQIPVAVRPVLGDPSQGLHAPFKTPADTSSAPALTGFLRPVPLAVLGMLVAAVALYSWPDTEPVLDGSSALSRVAQQLTGSDTYSAVVVATGDASSASSASGSISTDTQATPEASQPPVALPDMLPDAGSGSMAGAAAVPSSPSSATPSPAANAQAAPVTGAPGILNLQASGEVWVEVSDGRGQTLVQRMLKAGDSVDLSAEPPYAVVIGRSDVVQVRVRGEPLDITPHTRNSVARFEVK